MSDLAEWIACSLPDAACLEGRFVTAMRYEAARDGEALYQAIGRAEEAHLWDHIPVGPFEDATALMRFLNFANDKLGWITYIFRGPAGPDGPDGGVLGMSSYMRLRPEHGSAEVGSVIFSPRLQRTPAATEAMYLMARHLFDDLGYRRYEWKCNAKNEASARAATRFGFTFEGTFRQDMVMKGKNRDTHWFSMLDREWPRAEAAFDAWLAPDNFDETGGQKSTLAEIRSKLQQEA
ncbi:MAG: GNAT family protein [Parvibaculum sp.]